MDRGKKFVTHLDVRFRDLDAMGHVNNAVYLTYLEQGRLNFVSSVFDISKPQDYFFIIAHISCDYLKPITLGDGLFLEMWVGEIGRKHFEFLYRLLKKGPNDIEYMECAKARSVQVFFDYINNKTMEPPSHIVETLKKYQYKEK